MQLSKSPPHRKSAAGFTLPAILVVVGALLIIAVASLLVVGIERNTSRAFSDRERANLAARAGLEDVKGIFAKEASNDDFLILQDIEDKASGATKDPTPYLYLARGTGGGEDVSYRYVPLFSTKTIPTAPTPGIPLEAPLSEDLIGTLTKDVTTLPWYDPAKVSWIEVPNEKGKVVSRYAYWVEDLQSRVDAGTAGNTKDTAGAHKRYGWRTGDMAKTEKSAKFPAPGLNAQESKPGADGRDAEPPLDQVALYALDPDSGAKDTSTLDKTIIDGRKALISPDSVLAVAGVTPPLTRGPDGQLVDLKARALEANLTAAVQPYDEQPLVPFAYDIDASATGKPKLNLNALLAKPPANAVDEMADWINKSLPTFAKRGGGFPDNYLKTLAANAIDYADTDSDATVSAGSIMGNGAYRGLDAYPLMSEVILHIKYLGTSVQRGRRVLLWQMIVFTELWNHTNFRVTGRARVSYENGMRPPAIGAGVIGDRFDDPVLMDDTTQVTSIPPLKKINDRYWSGELDVDLVANQYKFYKAATINYTMDVGPSSQFLQNRFEIYEDLGSSGISMMWNDREVDRSDKLVRGNSSPTNPELEFITNTAKQSGKANIPGHSYGIYNTVNNYKNNMGDSRQALYLRGAAYPLSDNSYPSNVSPNRRNIRNFTIYKSGANQSAVYGRVLPSEWPDGGHDTPVSLWSPLSPAALNYDPSTYADFKSTQIEGDTPTFISNRGRFYSATELGRIFDPIMFTPKYDSAGDTATLLTGTMPPNRVSWPSVEASSNPDIYYGGGNTLRIGRPEHPNFDQPASHAPADMPGDHAARLLDLFHAGKSRSETQEDREGSLVRIEGHVNINTASEDAIRALAGGLLVSDPRLVRRTAEAHSATTFAPPVSTLEISAPTSKELNAKEGDLLAKAIIQGRPFSSPSEIASVLNTDGKLVFGNKFLYPYTPNASKPDISQLQWSDAAAEEVFARVYESSTIRSRNFRVWVIGQAIAPSVPNNPTPEVLSEVRRVFTIFADPGTRKTDGAIDATKFKTRIIHENDF
jgi:type II secretory pathway pseudopilin PulG